MFLDASAIVALIAREPGYEVLARRLHQAGERLTSAIAVFEAVLALRRLDDGAIPDAERRLRDFLETFAIATMPIADAEATVALAAFARFGKGQRHPARLNMGDCFAYACARTQGVPLLFVGDDFARIDIDSATA